MLACMYGGLSFGELFGVTPAGLRLKQAAFALRGDEYTPRSRFDLTTMKIAQPRIAMQAWIGRRRADRLAPITNLFNHAQTPIEEGWSVRKRQTVDFRGGDLTYDSHNGTDFAVPPGIHVVAPAPGLVVRVSSEFHRGGLKIAIDHGDNLITTCNHLGRVTARVGDVVKRGQRIALTGASGIDMVTGFPWMPPHVHFNTWLNGEPIDPFARDGETSVWTERNSPRPFEGRDDEVVRTSTVSDSAFARALAECRDGALRDRLAATPDKYRASMELIFEQNYYPTRFTQRLSPFGEVLPRSARIDLPFEANDYVGTIFADSPNI